MIRTARTLKKSREEVLDQIILEFLKTLADDVRVFVRERNPELSEKAAKLADGYLQARKEDLASRDVSKRAGDKSGKRCLRRDMRQRTAVSARAGEGAQCKAKYMEAQERPQGCGVLLS